MPVVLAASGDRTSDRGVAPHRAVRVARFALAAAVLSMAGACATRPGPRAAEIPFQCEDGRRFTAAFTRNPDLAVVRVQGSELALPGTASGHGDAPAHYTDGRNALHGRGMEATLELEGLPPSRGCVRVAEAPPQQTRARVSR
jgi:membrane-bound inhibitor of C-type lysozyme